ncbi:hypothetical protein ICL81_06965 [Leucobacter sp. cx-328]|uniref:hypothetical protein n=1 Tax=unclassified Leucobacter TaxID=2621730 RepID=UPI00165D8739|nr:MULTISPECIES: hypothetical protein [unclassified Leucobacter]MBC9944247.1 hypothetical protein [Leucobacter sp. cx-328]
MNETHVTPSPATVATSAPLAQADVPASQRKAPEVVAFRFGLIAFSATVVAMISPFIPGIGMLVSGLIFIMPFAAMAAGIVGIVLATKALKATTHPRPARVGLGFSIATVAIPCITLGFSIFAMIALTM